MLPFSDIYRNYTVISKRKLRAIHATKQVQTSKSNTLKEREKQIEKEREKYCAEKFIKILNDLRCFSESKKNYKEILKIKKNYF